MENILNEMYGKYNKSNIRYNKYLGIVPFRDEEENNIYYIDENELYPALDILDEENRERYTINANGEKIDLFEFEIDDIEELTEENIEIVPARIENGKIKPGSIKVKALEKEKEPVIEDSEKEVIEPTIEEIKEDIVSINDPEEIIIDAEIVKDEPSNELNKTELKEESVITEQTIEEAPVEENELENIIEKEEDIMEYTEEMKEFIKDYESKIKEIENGYNKPKELIEVEADLRHAINEREKFIAEKDLYNPSSFETVLKEQDKKIQELQDKVNNINSNKDGLDVEQRELNKIAGLLKNVEKAYESLTPEEKQKNEADYLKEKRDLTEKLMEARNKYFAAEYKNNPSNKRKEKEIAINDFNTKLRQEITNELKTLKRDKEELENLLNKYNYDIKYFEYKYDENHVPLNGNEYRELNEKREKLIETIKDYDKNIKLCEDKLAYLNSLDNKKVEGINNIIKEAHEKTSDNPYNDRDELINVINNLKNNIIPGMDETKLNNIIEEMSKNINLLYEIDQLEFEDKLKESNNIDEKIALIEARENQIKEYYNFLKSDNLEVEEILTSRLTPTISNIESMYNTAKSNGEYCWKEFDSVKASKDYIDTIIRVNPELGAKFQEKLNELDNVIANPTVEAADKWKNGMNEFVANVKEVNPDFSSEKMLPYLNAHAKQKNKEVEIDKDFNINGLALAKEDPNKEVPTDDENKKEIPKKKGLKVIAKKALKWMKEHKLVTIALGLALVTTLLFTIPTTHMMINSALWHLGNSLGWSAGSLANLHNINLGLAQVAQGGKFAYEAGTGMYTLAGAASAQAMYGAGAAKLVGAIAGLTGLGTIGTFGASIINKIKNRKKKKEETPEEEIIIENEEKEEIEEKDKDKEKTKEKELDESKKTPIMVNTKEESLELEPEKEYDENTDKEIKKPEEKGKVTPEITDMLKEMQEQLKQMQTQLNNKDLEIERLNKLLQEKELTEEMQHKM